MKCSNRPPVIFLLSTLVFPAQAAINWTSAPIITSVNIKGADRRSESAFRPLNISQASMQDYPPAKGESKPDDLTALGDGSFKIKLTDKSPGNYHWLTATDAQGLRFASTVHYFANPGPSPRKTLQQIKLPLEIKPLNLPREHQRFRANENWDFIVLADGKPVARTQVEMETSNGSKATLTTDNNGIVSVNFPDDFAAYAEKHKNHAMGHASHGRKSAQFVLSVEYHDRTSAFNYRYAEDAFNNKLILPALGLAFAGSLVTGILTLGRKAA
jgi:hypothetical protein